ncbi:MAG: class I SAM-dependent methyltransferase, partial [Nevskiales bacterium]|nr:class I SAM-dependent methyltransferase [Nevskiales bacterium]
MRKEPTRDAIRIPVPQDRDFSFALQERQDRLELLAAHHPGYGTVCADWNTAEIARRIASGRRQPLARAVGLDRHRDLRILDATAGLGRDGFILAALGARVTMIERHPIVAALLHDARRRALARPETSDAAARTEVVKTEASQYLAQAIPGTFDVIYLDPMFPDRGKTALA